MAIAKKTKTARGRKQDRARVAGGQDYEVRYEAKKTGRSATSVKKAVKKVGNARKRVEKRLARKKYAAGYCGGHSGQVSPIDSRTFQTSATAASGEMPGGGSWRAMSVARSRA